MYKLEYNEDIESYLEAKDMIFHHLDSSCSKDERLDWLEFLLNIGIRRLNLGQTEYVRHSFDVLKEGMRYRVFHHGNKLPVSVFMNIVLQAAMFYDQLDWLEVFIEEYKNDLVEDKKEDSLILAKAQLNFAKKEFEEVTRSLHQIELFHFEMNLIARSLNLKSIVELEFLKDGYYSMFTDTCEAYTKYLKRNNGISAARKEANYNFINLTKAIVKQKDKYTDQGIRQVLIDKIKATTTFGKDWLRRIVRKL